MEDDGLNSIDWCAAWLAPLRSVGSAIAADSDWLEALNRHAQSINLQSFDGRALRFAAASALPPGSSYEAFIAERASIPTRRNRHDFFNALIWLHFPKLKAALNQLHFNQMLSGITPQRGSVRDAATLFDENAVLLAYCDDHLVQLLRAHRWRDLFVVQRAEFQAHADVTAFGHALMDKLVAPFDAITAHVWAIKVDAAYFNWGPVRRRLWLDEAIAQDLADRLHSPRDFMPLPVLGIPGWWPRNEDENFYDNDAVFRPPRRATAMP